MKQRITVEQLNELTDEQKERLRVWWKPQIGDWIIDTEEMEGPIEDLNKGGGDPIYSYGGKWITEKSKCLPLLSIGQMIELTESTNIIKYNGGWALEEDAISFHDELCDALWEAVKQVL
jgi:hypothetical protein